MKSNKSIVFLACTGLGRINRGYESFARECFDSLKDAKEFDFYLIKGGGKKSTNEIVLPNLHRKSRAALWIGKVFQKESYLIEQFTFCISLLPLIVFKRPLVIYYSDFILGTYLWHLRRILKFRYKLLFSNGAPNPPPFKTEDHVQQLLPTYVLQATRGGTSPDKQTLLPYAINIDITANVAKINDIKLIRQKLQLPIHKKVVISVGAINTKHKRMDYVINEFSKLNADKYFLLILGQTDNETNLVINLALQKLLKKNFTIKEVTKEEVAEFMAASDYFVLASLNEGLPRVLPEALSHGLLPIVHDYAVTRQTLENYGIFKDLTMEGALAEGISEADIKYIAKNEIIDFAWKTYSWDKLKPKYKKMIIDLI